MERFSPISLHINDRFGAQTACESLRLPDSTEACVPAGQGYTEVLVFRPLTVGVLATGSELLTPGEEVEVLCFVQ